MYNKTLFAREGVAFVIMREKNLLERIGLIQKMEIKPEPKFDISDINVKKASGFESEFADSVYSFDGLKDRTQKDDNSEVKGFHMSGNEENIKNNSDSASAESAEPYYNTVSPGENSDSNFDSSDSEASEQNTESGGNDNMVSSSNFVYNLKSPEKTQAKVTSRPQEVDILEVLNPDEYSTVEQIYDAYGQKSDTINTIYIIDAFSKALPASLSEDEKRSCIQKTMQSLSININELLLDASARAESLTCFLENFKEYTDQIINTCSQEVKNMELEIAKYKKEISARTNLRSKQEEDINREISNIKDILSFISNS